MILKEQEGKSRPLDRARRELVRRHPGRFRPLFEDELAALGRRFCDCGAELVGDSACWACPGDEHWRPGGEGRRTLYIHRDGGKRESVGMVESAAWAAAICDAMNARGSTERSETRAAGEQP